MSVIALTKSFEFEYDLNEEFLGDLVANFVLGNYWNRFYQKRKNDDLKYFELEKEFKALESFLRSISLFSSLADAILLLPENVLGLVFPINLVYSAKKRVLYIGHNSLTIRGTKVTLTCYEI